jgi:hypothetical protein
MNGSGALIVGGSTLFGGGSEEGLLNSGTIQVTGGITQQAFSSPSSFRMDGAVLDLPVGPSHVLNFETADSSWLPDITSGGAASLSLIIVGRVRVAGGVSGYGVTISGDTLITADPLSAGPAGLSVTLGRYEGPVFYQFQNVSTWTVTTTQFTGDGGLPYSNDFAFDTLIVSANVQGQLSQLLTANYVEVTGPGNPRHIGGSVGALGLSGGDGNTTLNVSGDVVVRGAGTHITNDDGSFNATGDLTVDQGAYLYSTGGFSGAVWGVNGDVLVDGASTVDSLVKGSLFIQGNFTQKASTSGSAWAPDSTFTTYFQGTGNHLVSFATPSAAGGGGSHFGSLGFSTDDGLVLQTDTDLWVEGTLTTSSYADPTLQNTDTVLHTLHTQDVSIQGITFDHLQLHLAKTGTPAAGTGSMDIVNFNNFLTTEDQFLVDLPGQSIGNTWSNFNFTQLDTLGGDSGHYIIANDNDGSTPDILTISLGGLQINDPAIYFVALNGAIINFFAP